MSSRRIATLALVLVACGLASACALRPSLDLWPQLQTHGGARAPGSIDVRFLGTTSLAFTLGDHTVLIDGFVSRPDAETILLRPLSADETLIRRHLGRAGIQRIDAVFVAHTHFDHALDAPTIARLYEARLFGDAGLAVIAQADGFTGETVVLSHGGRHRFGDITVTSVVSPHSPGDLAPGPVPDNFDTPARARRYRGGTSHAFHIETPTCRLLVVPSAGVPGPVFEGLAADVVLLGIGRLGPQSGEAIDAYWRDTVQATGARRVVPIHWDDFTRPLDAPLVAMPYALDRVDRALARLQRLAGEAATVSLPLTHVPLDLATAGRCL
jgi:L-ascorbate metabolism protein UlaG (beta-lactamase superfamily)